MESLSLSPLWKSAPKNRTEPHGLLPIETIACDDWSGELKGPGTVPILVPGEIPWACVTDIFILKAEGPVSMQNDSILKILHISWKLHHFPCNTAPEYNPFPQYIKWTVSVSSINIQLSAYIAHVATFLQKDEVLTQCKLSCMTSSRSKMNRWCLGRDPLDWKIEGTASIKGKRCEARASNDLQRGYKMYLADTFPSNA